MTFKMRIIWLKSILALVFFCSVLDLSVMAQINTPKPITASSVTVLHPELKENVTELDFRSAAAPTKSELVRKLIGLTLANQPYVGVEEQLASLPGTDDLKAEEERIRNVRIEVFNEALDVNNKLTPEQKSFVRASYPQLMQMADRITEDAINKNFPTEQWIKEGLQKSYRAKFTIKELNSLVNYFDGTSGRQVLKFVRTSEMAQLITGNGGTLDYTVADKAEHDKFMATPLGKKFRIAYITEAQAYVQRKEETVRTRNPDADGFAIYRSENLNKLFEQFVRENSR